MFAREKARRLRFSSSGSLLPQSLVAELAKSFVPKAERSKLSATSAASATVHERFPNNQPRNTRITRKGTALFFVLIAPGVHFPNSFIASFPFVCFVFFVVKRAPLGFGNPWNETLCDFRCICHRSRAVS